MADGDGCVTIHMATSLDGFIARKDGSVDWLETSDEFKGGEAVFVSGDHPLVEVDVANEGPIPICFVYLSPSLAESWGQDELESTEVIDPTETRTFFVPAATYDISVDDCDGETLAEEYELDMSDGGTYTVS